MKNILIKKKKIQVAVLFSLSVLYIIDRTLYYGENRFNGYSENTNLSSKSYTWFRIENMYTNISRLISETVFRKLLNSAFRSISVSKRYSRWS